MLCQPTWELLRNDTCSGGQHIKPVIDLCPKHSATRKRLPCRHLRMILESDIRKRRASLLLTCRILRYSQRGPRIMSSANTAESDSAAVSKSTERRRNLRFPFTATAEVVDSKTGAKVVGRTSDLGLGGCYVDTLSPFPSGTTAKLRILREKESFEAQARVIYSSIGMGMGLAFVSAEQEHVQLFQKWLAEISGQSVVEKDAPGTARTEKTQTLTNVVLSNLILTLIQKRILTEGEGKDLLRMLYR